MSIAVAFRAFFAALFSAKSARAIRAALDGNADGASPADASATKPPPPAPKPKAPARNDAITLLATLQRDARFVDLVKESLDGFSDAEIGAAARPVLQESGQVLDRLFGLQPLSSEEEGSTLEVPAGFDPARFHVTGEVTGAPPYQGTIAHHGWLAQRCELPKWNGRSDAALIVAATEVSVE